MDLGAIGCLGVLLIPSHALDRDISNVCANTLFQRAEEIVVLGRIFGAKAPRILPVSCDCVHEEREMLYRKSSPCV